MATFTAREVAKFHDMPVGTLNHWISKRYVPGIDPNPEFAGKARQFTVRDVCNISILKFIIEQCDVDPRLVMGRYAFGLCDFFTKGLEAYTEDAPHWWAMECRAGNTTITTFTATPDQFAEEVARGGHGPLKMVSKIDTSAIVIETLNRLNYAYAGHPGAVIGEPDGENDIITLKDN